MFNLHNYKFMKKKWFNDEGSSDSFFKWLRVMKLTVFFLLVSLVHVSAGVYSQQTKLNISLKEATVKDVLKTIEDQSEFFFLYKNGNIDENRIVNVEVREKTVEYLLDLLFRGTSVSYEVVNRQIVLVNRDQHSSLPPGQQQKGVSGKVKDSAGASLPGVSVVVKGTTTGTITDIDGKYSIASFPANAVLQFSFVGMKTQEIVVGNQLVIDVLLEDQSVGLDEIVAVGYGTTKKASVSGSIVAVKGDKLQLSPATNFTNTLAGRLPGLVTVNYSGEPGNDNATIRIRGSNTLGDNSPLVVIDGVANRNMTRLDPSTIDNVTILKDASAAIYGAQAANGVILITTKRGKLGKPEINVNLNYGLSQLTVIPRMADAATYATMINEIDTYAGQKATYTADEIRKFGDGSEPLLYPNTDWFGKVFMPFSKQQSGDVSVSGGSENMKYFLQSGFNNQGAIYRNSNKGYSQVDFRANIDGKISDNINLSVNLSGRQENRDFAPTSTIFTYMLNRSKPIFIDSYPGDKPASGYEAGANPVVTSSDLVGYNKSKTYNLAGDVKLAVTIPWVKGLSVTGNLSFDKDIFNSKEWKTPYMLYSWDRVSYDANKQPILTGALSGPTLDPTLTQNITDGQKIMLNLLLNYEVSFADKHHIKFLSGVEKITGESMDLMAYRRGFVSTAIDQMFAGSDIAKDNGGSSANTARLNYFGRLNYDYLQKYLVEFVYRYDGSYIFPDQGRFGFFPGVSVGWKVSEENFWKNNISLINYFKLRGSWGQTGNDRITPYQYLSSYGFGVTPYVFNGNVQVKPLTELRIANPNVTWEVANQSNIGFDGQMFNGKVQFSAEYFYNLRTNILWFRNASVPASTGLTLPRENIGEVVNQGYELQLGYNGTAGDFKYGITGNLSFADNKIKFWDEVPGVPDYQQSTGRPMNAGLYYHAIGIFKDQAAVDGYPHWAKARPGDIIFEDVNLDKIIDGLDRVRNTKSEIPKFTGGLSIDLGYKNFYASILFQGAAGAVRTYNLEAGKIGDFLADDAEGRWTAENPTASKPRTWNTGGEYWSTLNNTYWLKSNDYLRLKNLQFGYNVPKTFSDKLNIKELTIYFTGLNLFTMSPLKSFDPETVGTAYPLSKVYNFGLRLTF
jgi:TonB-linked SusC/RagA family outer membrane protein